MTLAGAMMVVAFTQVGPSEAAHQQRVYEQALLGYAVTPEGLSATEWYIVAAISGGISAAAALVAWAVVE